MKKFFTSLTFIVAFTAYTLYETSGRGAALEYASPVATTTAQQSTPVPIVEAPAPKPEPAPVPKPIPAPAPKPQGQYRDGSYTGSVADAYYGNVQVVATIAGGKIADVTFLQYPNDRSTSRSINGQAMPVLRQEAITAQSAKVDTVSGASDTSGAFRESLGSALAEAKS